MKQLVVLSGKGGTGKTSVTASLASLWREEVVCVDADVDAANLHLLLRPKNRRREAFIGGKVAVHNAERCTLCGRCSDLCRFHAIDRGRVNRVACEGCGLCVLACPEKALCLRERSSGHWFEGITESGPLFYARLAPGEGNSGKLVGQLRQSARAHARCVGSQWILTDGPPGTGCPTMAALTGNDAVLAVTEPTASGIHDLERLLDLAETFQVKAFVCINKADLAADFGMRIHALCRKRDVPVAGIIPFDPVMVEGARRGLPAVRWPHSAAAQALVRLQKNLSWLLGLAAERRSASGGSVAS